MWTLQKGLMLSPSFTSHQSKSKQISKPTSTPAATEMLSHLFVSVNDFVIQFWNLIYLTEHMIKMFLFIFSYLFIYLNKKELFNFLRYFSYFSCSFVIFRLPPNCEQWFLFMFWMHPSNAFDIAILRIEKWNGFTYWEMKRPLVQNKSKN